MTSVNVKCRPLFKDPIANELVFESRHERNIQNSFRFVFMSYIYNLGINVSDMLISKNSAITASAIRHHLYLSPSNRNSKNIRADIIDSCCKFLKIDFSYLYAIALKFRENSSYNAISFSPDSSVIFFKAYKHSFGS